MQIFYAKPNLLLVSLFVRSSIDVHLLFLIEGDRDKFEVSKK